MKRAKALISGGVDSSVALYLALNSGEFSELQACYLKIWLEDDWRDLTDCPWKEDVEFAQAICERFEVPFTVLPFQQIYHDSVLSYAVQSLEQGETPSPDVFCNTWVKFGAFLDRASTEEQVISGHYGQIVREEGHARLQKAVDPVKDQSYFLSRLSQEQLQRIHLPLGKLPKAEVRRLAASLDLPNASRKDSQGLCFLGKIRFPDFVQTYVQTAPGPFVDIESGQAVGQHQGAQIYTIGQRKGLGLSGGPWFVVRKDLRANTVYLAHQSTLADHVDGKRVFVQNMHFLSPLDREVFKTSATLSCKLRHGPKTIPVEIEVHPKFGTIVHLKESDCGIAPGQICVFYEQESCLGSGIMAQPTL